MLDCEVTLCAAAPSYYPCSSYLVGRNSGFAQGADLTGTVFSRGLELAEIDSKASIRRIQSD